MVLRVDLMLVAIWSRTSLRAILKDLPPTRRCVGNMYNDVGCDWKRFYSAALIKDIPTSGWAGGLHCKDCVLARTGATGELFVLV